MTVTTRPATIRRAPVPAPALPTGAIDFLRVRRNRLLIAVFLTSAVAWNPWGLAPFLALRGVTAPVVVGVGCGLALLGGASPRRSVSVAGLLFIGSAVVSTALSSSPLVGLFGMPGRQAGLLALVVMVGAGFLGAVVGSTPTGRTDLTIGLVVTGSAAAAVGVIQRVGATLPGLAEVGVSGRVTGSSGSAAQLGALLALCIAPTLWLVLDRSGRIRRAVSAALVLQVAGLVLSQARAAWLGAGLGAAIVVVASAGGRDADARRRFLRRCAVGFVVVAGAVLAVPSTRDRAFSLFDVGSGTGRGRLTGWGAALRAIAGQPFFGVGLDQTRAVLPGELPARYELRYGGAEIVDRAHDVFLDQLLWTGAVGLVAVVVLGAVWWRHTRTVRSDGGVVALLAGGAAFGVHLLVNFPMPELDVTVWFVLGAAAGSSLLRPGSGEVRPRRLGAIGVGVVMLAISTVGVRNLVADLHAADGVRAEARGDIAAALAAYGRAADVAPEQLVYREVFARALLRTGSPDAQAAGARVGSFASGDPFSRELALRTAVLDAYVEGDTARGAALRGDYELLVAEVPSRVQFRVGLGLAALASGDPESARTIIALAADATPGDAGILRTLAMVDDVLGRTADARRHRERADCLTRSAPTGTPNAMEVCGS